MFKKALIILLSQACDKINNVYYLFLNKATSHENEMLIVLQMLRYLFKLSLQFKYLTQKHLEIFTFLTISVFHAI